MELPIGLRKALNPALEHLWACGYRLVFIVDFFKKSESD